MRNHGSMATPTKHCSTIHPIAVTRHNPGLLPLFGLSGIQPVPNLVSLFQPRAISTFLSMQYSVILHCFKYLDALLFFFLNFLSAPTYFTMRFSLTCLSALFCATAAIAARPHHVINAFNRIEKRAPVVEKREQSRPFKNPRLQKRASRFLNNATKSESSKGIFVSRY